MMIETERLLLRCFLPEDWAAVHAYASIPEVSRFDSWGPNTPEDTRTFIAHCIEAASAVPRRRYDLAIVIRSSGRLIGGCAIKLDPATAMEARLGFAVHPDYQGKGFATEATAGMIEFGFSELGLDRIVAQCDTRNSASYRVMEKAGMKRVGTHLRHREYKGELTHSYEYEVHRQTPANP